MREAIVSALKADYGEIGAQEIAFHLHDWIGDAEFLVQLHENPNRFTPEEIKQEVMNHLVYAPNHLAAAALISGNPVKDIFYKDNRFRIGPKGCPPRKIARYGASNKYP
jgi:hypothetical protein